MNLLRMGFNYLSDLIMNIDDIRALVATDISKACDFIPDYFVQAVTAQFAIK